MPEQTGASHRRSTRRKRRRRRRLILAALLLSGSGVLILLSLRWYLADWQDTEAMKRANAAFTGKMQTAEPQQQTGEPGTGIDPKEERTLSTDAGSAAVLEKYRTLHEESPDFAGWIRVHCLYQIDFPVFLRDNSFYLTHDAQGETNEKGAAFLDEESTLVPRDDNLIVYAHNLASGEMFGSLFRMGDRKYLDRDPFVTFSTLYEEDEYVPVAVLVTTVGQGAKDFHFMVNSFATEESFQTFVAEARERSRVQLNVDCRWGDKLLTLVTCNDEARTERLIVLLRRLREGEDAAALASEL